MSNQKKIDAFASLPVKPHEALEALPSVALSSIVKAHGFIVRLLPQGLCLPYQPLDVGALWFFCLPQLLKLKQLVLSGMLMSVQDFIGISVTIQFIHRNSAEEDGTAYNFILKVNPSHLIRMSLAVGFRREQNLCRRT